MTIQVARLAKLLPGLPVEERFDAVLARFREDAPPDWDLAESIPAGDARRWKRLIGLLHATHIQFGWYVEYVEATVTQLELRYALLLGLQLSCLAMDQHMLSLLLDPEAEERRAKIREKQQGIESRREQLAATIADELSGRWLDVRLAEIGADSLARECAGRDIVHPETRAKLDDCRTRLLSLKANVVIWVECELPEPEDAQVQGLLELLEREAER